ncbi:MAG TPA: hypothetical protein VG096_11545 [Bryobacteraceae bacterium]|jgi:hypothetical protein|nr:hypothetical protein [Bryobacteraceae bacterium]
MPNKTIYVRDADVPLLERASEELGESISALFASFLRDRVATLTSQEKQVVQLIKRIREDRVRLHKEGTSKEAVSEFQQAEAYALKVLEAVRKQDYEAARNLWFGANSYHAIAHRSAANYRKIAVEIDRVLRGASPTNGTSTASI